MGRKSKEQIELEKAYRSLTIYVIFSILALITYTIVEQIISSVTGVSHDTLTTCFFAAFGGEILTCGLIKIFKLQKEGKDECEADE